MGLRFVYVFCFVCSIAIAQEVFEESALKQDFEILSKVVVEVAPTLKPSEKEGLLATLQERKAALTGARMTALEFFVFLKNTNFGIVVDEHAGLELPEKVIQSLIPKSPVLFPLPISIQNNKVLVNHDAVALPLGSEITAIDGLPISKVLASLVRRPTSLAYRELKRQFDIAYLIEYGESDSFQLTYISPKSSETQETRLASIDLDTRQQLMLSRIHPVNRDGLKNLMNSSFDSTHDLYYLQINGFEWREPTKDVTKEFNNAFNDIFKAIAKQNPKHLVIDIRYNGGGQMNIPGLLYSYLAKSDFSEVLRSKVPDFELPYLEYIPVGKDRTPNPKEVVKNLEAMKQRYQLRGDYYENEFINRSLKPNKRAYQGDIILLISGHTASAASYFTALFKSQNRGIIVGEPIGGAHDGITAVKNVPYILPNTSIKISMPLGILNCSDDMRRLVPENKIQPDYNMAEDEKYRHFLLKEDWDLKEVYKHLKK